MVWLQLQAASPAPGTPFRLPYATIATRAGWTTPATTETHATPSTSSSCAPAVRERIWRACQALQQLGLLQVRKYRLGDVTVPLFTLPEVRGRFEQMPRAVLAVITAQGAGHDGGAGTSLLAQHYLTYRQILLQPLAAGVPALLATSRPISVQQIAAGTGTGRDTTRRIRARLVDLALLYTTSIPGASTRVSLEPPTARRGTPLAGVANERAHQPGDIPNSDPADSVRDGLGDGAGAGVGEQGPLPDLLPHPYHHRYLTPTGSVTHVLDVSQDTFLDGPGSVRSTVTVSRRASATPATPSNPDHDTHTPAGITDSTMHNRVRPTQPTRTTTQATTRATTRAAARAATTGGPGPKMVQARRLANQLVWNTPELRGISPKLRGQIRQVFIHDWLQWPGRDPQATLHQIRTELALAASDGPLQCSHAGIIRATLHRWASDRHTHPTPGPTANSPVGGSTGTQTSQTDPGETSPGDSGMVGGTVRPTLEALASHATRDATSATGNGASSRTLGDDDLEQLTARLAALTLDHLHQHPHLEAEQALHHARTHLTHQLTSEQASQMGDEFTGEQPHELTGGRVQQQLGALVVATARVRTAYLTTLGHVDDAHVDDAHVDEIDEIDEAAELDEADPVVMAQIMESLTAPRHNSHLATAWKPTGKQNSRFPISGARIEVLTDTDRPGRMDQAHHEQNG